MDFYGTRYEQIGGPALEPMCGTGRFLIPFLERGSEIDGTDASPDMLDACWAKLARRGLSTGIYEQFLQELQLPRQYAFIFIAAGSFSLIPSRSDAVRALERLREHLQPTGTLIVEALAPAQGGEDRVDAPRQPRGREAAHRCTAQG